MANTILGSLWGAGVPGPDPMKHKSPIDQKSAGASIMSALDRGDWSTARNIIDAMNQVKAAHSHSLSGVASVQAYADPVASSNGRMAAICMRLRLPVGSFPLKNFETFLEGDTVYVAIVTAAGATFLEDSKEMFPSDTFISQLRLLLP
jgi:hypothetical protein